MSVRWKQKKNKFPEMTKALETMGGKSVKVGALQGEHSW